MDFFHDKPCGGYGYDIFKRSHFNWFWILPSRQDGFFCVAPECPHRTLQPPEPGSVNGNLPSRSKYHVGETMVKRPSVDGLPLLHQQYPKMRNPGFERLNISIYISVSYCIYLLFSIWNELGTSRPLEPIWCFIICKVPSASRDLFSSHGGSSFLRSKVECPSWFFGQPWATRNFRWIGCGSNFGLGKPKKTWMAWCRSWVDLSRSW